MGCWWQQDANVMHALSSIFATVHCREAPPIRPAFPIVTTRLVTTDL